MMRHRKRVILRKWLIFLILNFATPGVFFLVFRMAGAKWAICFALLSTLLQSFAHWIYRRPITPFFGVSSGFTLLLGWMDLVIDSPRYFRLAPGLESFALGILFYGSSFTKTPWAAWFAQSLPGLRKMGLLATGPVYLKKVTRFWAAYFFFKGALFLYVGLRVDLGQLVLFRAIFGTSTLVLMFFGEWAYRRFRA